MIETLKRVLSQVLHIWDRRDVNAVPEKLDEEKLSLMGWMTICVLMSFLVISLWYGVHVWTSMAGVRMSSWGWFTLILGVVFTIGVGGGLMALVFYSSRHDYDQ